MSLLTVGVVSAPVDSTGATVEQPRIDQILEVQRQTVRIVHDDFEGGYVAGNDLGGQNLWALDPGVVGAGRLKIDGGSKLGGIMSVNYTGAGSPNDVALYVVPIPNVRAIGSDTAAAGYAVEISITQDSTKYTGTAGAKAAHNFYVTANNGDVINNASEWSITVNRTGDLVLYDSLGAIKLNSLAAVADGKHILRVEINQGQAIQVFLDGVSVYGPTVGTYDTGVDMTGVVIGTQAHGNAPSTDCFMWDGLSVETPTVAPAVTNILRNGEITLAFSVQGLEKISYQTLPGTGFGTTATLDLEVSGDGINWDPAAIFRLFGTAAGTAFVYGVPLSAAFARFRATLPLDYDNSGVQVVTTP